jgi:hypothetical protein
MKFQDLLKNSYSFITYDIQIYYKFKKLSIDNGNYLIGEIRFNIGKNGDFETETIIPITRSKRRAK